MRLSTLCVATALAVGSIGMAQAVPVNFVQNGDFSQTTSPKSNPTQFGQNSGTNSSGTWGGQFVTDWLSTPYKNSTGYSIWEPSASLAGSVQPTSQFGSTGRPLVASVTAPPVGAGTFIAMDGESAYSVVVSQAINGLTKGQAYLVSFYWGGAETTKATKTTTINLTVSLGSQSHTTPTLTQPAGAFSGWQLESFKFVANSTSELLSFLSMGTPAGLPPMALLTGVSMHKVPEPSVLAMFGGGLLGLGLLTVFARRNAARRCQMADGSDIA